jgi:hypothetical protein
MSTSDFDHDDALRSMLRGGDPAGSLSPADPAALASLLEDIMSADLDVRPESDEGNRATGTHGRNRLTWLVAAAAVAAIAGVGGVALSGLGDSSAPPSAGKQTPTVKDPQVGTPGVTTALGVAEQQGRCAEATPELLAQYDVAFQGTVTSIEGNTVTLDTTEVLNGEVGEAVQVTAPAGIGAMLGTVNFQVGGSYLVAAFNGQLSQCYSGSASGDLRSPFDKAFIH